MILITVLIVIVSVLLVLVVLAQNSKGGGLTSQFGGAVIYATQNVNDNPTVIVVSDEIQFYKNGSSFVTYADYSGKDVRASGSYLTS